MTGGRAFHRRSVLTGLPALVAASLLTHGSRGMAAPRHTADPFALGVASGDPSADGFVLWTRLVGENGATRAEPALPVAFEIATDAGFRNIVRRGERTVTAALGHSLHEEVQGLAPGRPYWYRFFCGDAVSPVGRTATMPARPDRLTFAVACCQHWEHGWFTGYQDMIARQPDFILFLGDYIYEKSWGDGRTVRRFDASDPHDLDAYRRRHALYKGDPDLQAAHRAAPWITVWDDHEVENDYAGLSPAETSDPALFERRRAAAYQAYFEHMPLRPRTVLQKGGYRLYRRFSFGDLASLHILDTRQFRDDQACATADNRGGQPLTQCAELGDPRRSMLGERQEAWLLDGLAQDEAHWTIMAQQTLFSRLDLVPGSEKAVWSDFWDGYPASRQRITDAIGASDLRNPVFLGGDLHSFWASEVKADYGDPNSRKIGTEFVATCLASHNPAVHRFGDPLRENSHIRYFNARHSGYAFGAITPEALTMDFRVADNMTRRDSGFSTLRRFRVENGRADILGG